MSRSLRVWIDLANSPHVHIFRPIIEELTARGHEVELTARDFAQTVGMAEQLGWEFTVIGHHGGKNLVRKSVAVVGRAVGLVRYAAGRGFDVALHHNSYAQTLAAAALRIPSIAMMDYEFQPANQLSFRLARRVLVPAPFPVEALAACGAVAKADWYPGIKEEIYLGDFEPDPSVLAQLGITEDDERVIVAMRPAPTMATYHRFENPLFDEIAAELAARDDVLLVILPRTDAQKRALESLASDTCILADQVVDALSLTYYADLVVGAGGTMNREAAVLGTPVYTAFAGKMGAVERERRAPRSRRTDLAGYLADAAEETVRAAQAVRRWDSRDQGRRGGRAMR
jgi:predicted glycosyltransferase